MSVEVFASEGGAFFSMGQHFDRVRASFRSGGLIIIDPGQTCM
jgi:hypothetical protein